MQRFVAFFVSYLFLIALSAVGCAEKFPEVPSKGKSHPDCEAGEGLVGEICDSGAVLVGVPNPDGSPESGGSGGYYGPYMMTPVGCERDSTSPNCLGKTDDNFMPWNSGMGDWHNIAGVEDVASSSTLSLDGQINTTAAAAISTPSQGGEHAAARWCENLEFAGFDDWYLPSKTELGIIYCLAKDREFHDTDHPHDQPNCSITNGKLDLLDGFNEGYYWSSTELDDKSVWAVNFLHGGQAYTAKDSHFNVRCLRKITP